MFLSLAFVHGGGFGGDWLCCLCVCVVGVSVYVRPVDIYDGHCNISSPLLSVSVSSPSVLGWFVSFLLVDTMLV